MIEYQVLCSGTSTILYASTVLAEAIQYAEAHRGPSPVWVLAYDTKNHSPLEVCWPTDDYSRGYLDVHLNNVADLSSATEDYVMGVLDGRGDNATDT